MDFDDYKVVLYRNRPDGWVAEIPAIPGCHALMPTRGGALAELAGVFRLISEEHRGRNEPLPADTTEIVHASARAAEIRRVAARLGFTKARQTGSHQELFDKLR
jgi:predicted RNase H-like HicB family nuclease